MSSLTITPDLVTAASGNLETLRSALRSSYAAAAGQTTSITAPAADEVSAAITTLFNTSAQEFQSLSTQVAAFHDAFVNLLSGGAAQYASAEAVNAQQTLVNAVGTGQVAAANAAATFDLTPIVNAANVAWNTFEDGVKAEAKSLGIDAAVENVEGAFGFEDTGWQVTASRTADSGTLTGGRTVTLNPHTLFGDGPTVTVASVQATGTVSASGSFGKVFMDFFGITSTFTGSAAPGSPPSFSFTPGPNPFENAFISQEQINQSKF
ncbi:PE family protein [Mycobacterium sp. 1081908.1]|uniref:PE family protein n=1 Tax=Mycobacterium sp. 1081908.1 TaxID=1834066 RepID=UPI0009EECC55|nr:PE family protein [Mycobacterium sp. 1081908.1]